MSPEERAAMFARYVYDPETGKLVDKQAAPPAYPQAPPAPTPAPPQAYAPPPAPAALDPQYATERMIAARGQLAITASPWAAPDPRYAPPELRQAAIPEKQPEPRCNNDECMLGLGHSGSCSLTALDDAAWLGPVHLPDVEEPEFSKTELAQRVSVLRMIRDGTLSAELTVPSVVDALKDDGHQYVKKSSVAAILRSLGFVSTERRGPRPSRDRIWVQR
jgi:hypothetical protein